MPNNRKERKSSPKRGDNSLFARGLAKYRSLKRPRTTIACALATVLGLVCCFGMTFPDCAALRTSNPAETNLMRIRAEEARDEGRTFSRRQQWVPLGSISNEAIRAVIAGEDFSFFAHGGFDFGEMKAALVDAIEDFSFPRGASTITQQLAKNLYLSESRTPLRKINEYFITWRLEQTLSKRRILEIYLNVIEWGEGIFGIEAAARNYFHKSARELNSEEGAMLAAMIPNPRTIYNPAKNPERVQSRKALIRKVAKRVNLPPL